jgi:hypothetical protein
MFRIPDTIILHNFPTTWYYWAPVPKPDPEGEYSDDELLNSGDDDSPRAEAKGGTKKDAGTRRARKWKKRRIYGEIREKGGKCLEKSIILKTFSALQNSPSCDTIATWMQKEADGAYSVQFFNHEELAVFLNGQHTGLLQSFVLPGSEYNEVLQAVWSPKICHVNKRINRWKLSDRAHARFEKAITYEGATHYTEEAVIAPTTAGKVKEVCESIVDHIGALDHHYAISRMVLYFKEDKNHPNILWLLYSSSFRIVEVRYREAKPLLTFAPKFELTSLQDTHNLELELPEEEESRVPSPSFRHTTAAVDQLMLGMPLNQKETVGSMILDVLEEGPVFDHRIYSLVDHMLLTQQSDELDGTIREKRKKERLPSTASSRAVHYLTGHVGRSMDIWENELQVLEAGRRSARRPLRSTSAAPLRVPLQTNTGIHRLPQDRPKVLNSHLATEVGWGKRNWKEAETLLATRSGRREAKKLRHQLHLSRQEGDALVLQADNLHRSMVSSKSSADSIFASQLLTPQQQRNRQLRDHVERLQQSCSSLASAGSESPDLSLKPRHFWEGLEPRDPASFPAARLKSPPLSKAKGRRGTHGRKAEKGEAEAKSPNVSKKRSFQFGMRKLTAAHKLASDPQKAEKAKQAPNPWLKNFNPEDLQTAEDAAGAELQRYLDKVLPVFKKSIDRSTDAEIKRNTKTVDEFEDRIYCVNNGLISAAAQIQWPDTRTVYDLILVPQSVHKVLETDEGQNLLVGAHMKTYGEFLKEQQMRKDDAEIHKYPTIQAVMAMSTRDPWYGDELTRGQNKKREVESARRERSPKKSTPQFPDTVDCVRFSPEVTEADVEYCVALPDRKSGPGKLGSVVDYVRKTMAKNIRKDAEQKLIDLVEHIKHARKSALWYRMLQLQHHKYGEDGDLEALERLKYHAPKKFRTTDTVGRRVSAAFGYLFKSPATAQGPSTPKESSRFLLPEGSQHLGPEPMK